MLITSSISGFERSLINQFNTASAEANLSLLRMATGQRIPAPRYNPSGFVSLERMRSELNVVNSTLTNVGRASRLAGDVQSVLTQIRTQLQTIRDLAAADIDGGLTDEQRAANQAAIDAAVANINRLAGTEFIGRRLLDAAPVVESDTEVTGVNSSQVVDFQVDSIKPGASTTISGNVTSTAGRAELNYSGKDGSRVKDTAVFDLTGNGGTARIVAYKNESLDNLRDRINQETANTGVTATVRGDDLILNSTGVGSDAAIAVNVLFGRFDVTGGNGNGTANGTDATAVINGQNLTGTVNRFSFSDNYGRYTMEFAAGFTGDFDPIQVQNNYSVTAGTSEVSFTVSADLSQQATLSITAVNAQSLGGETGYVDQIASGGSKSGLGAHAADAVRIADEALADLAAVETSVSTFSAVTLASTESVLTSMRTNLEEGIASINSVNEAEEAANLSRQMLLVENSKYALSMFAQQRMSLVSLLSDLASSIPPPRRWY